MFKYCLTGLLIFWCMGAIAQTLTVVDKQTNEPLELATLTSKNGLFAITNARGQANITEFVNEQKIQFRMIGYETITVSYSFLKEANFKIHLIPSGVSLDQIVVSATRWKQAPSKTAKTATLITAAENQLQNPQTSADLLANSGQVFMQKSQMGGGSPMIRGFATNRLLLVVDGVRMNTAIFRSGNIQNVISIDPFSVQTTEVLFGPGSVMYGSDAIGGVMSFQTLEPQFSTSKTPLIKGNATARMSSASSERTGHFDVNVGWQKWSFLASVSHNNFDDLLMGSNGPDEYLKPFYVQRVDGKDQVFTNQNPMLQMLSGYEQTNMMYKLRFAPNSHWNLQYAIHSSSTSNYGRYDRLMRTQNNIPRSAEWYYGPQKWLMQQLSIDYKKSTLLFDEMNLRFAYQNFEESRHDRDFADSILNQRFEFVDAYSVNLDLTKQLGNKIRFFYGAEAVLNTVESKGNSLNINSQQKELAPSRYPQSDWSSYGAYLTYQQELTQKWLLELGARYNGFAINAEFDTTFYPFPFSQTSINKSAVTGSFGLLFQANKTSSISANLSTGFRAPNIDDMGKVFDSEPGFVVVPNPNLNAEYAYNAELAFAKIFAKWFKLDGVAFYTLLNNALVRRDFALNGSDSMLYDGTMSKIQALQNAADAKVYGLQLGIEMKLPSGIGFSSRFNYQKGVEELEDGTSSPLRHSAPIFGDAHLTLTEGKLKLNLYCVYNGSFSYEQLPLSEQQKDYLYAKDDDGNPYSPAWYTLNFKVLYKLSDDLVLSGGIENITDQRYRTYSSGLAAPGRNFILSMNAKF